MTSGAIFLILISGLGVLHGGFLALFLWGYPKGNKISNKFLSLLLIALSFRVGKSVFLEFAESLQIQFIFIGLASLMTIGPLFYFYTISVLDESFKPNRKHIFHFIPAFLGLFFGVWIDKALIETLPKVFFILLFVAYYTHYLVYLFLAYRFISKNRKENENQHAVTQLKLIGYALLAIWATYVLNLFDELIQYIYGPILYTIIAYAVSFWVIKKGYLQTKKQTKYQTTSVSDEQLEQLFVKVSKLVVEEKQFKNGDLSLKSLSEQLHVTTQMLSMVINTSTQKNFNAFINQHRVEEVIRMFQNEQYDPHTIASIAYDAGFNSISSFNSAFKKYTGSTPAAYRKKLTERSCQIPK